MLQPADHFAIHDLLCRFFLAFDERDWDAMVPCLAEEVTIDYASSGRELPSTMPGRDFVELRKLAVDTLRKHHSFTNLLLSERDAAVRGRCNYLILRFAPEPAGEGEDFYHSCGSYEFDFSREREGWKISVITQQALRSWGNRELHGGSRKA